MSNYQVIATVTAAICDILSEVKTDVSETFIRSEHPDNLEDQTQQNIVNVFLYRVSQNFEYINLDLQRHNNLGSLIQRSPLLLNLHYIVTVYTKNDNQIQSQKILASVIRILDENSILTPEKNRETLQKNIEIGNSDLANQVELVKIIPESLSLDDITKLWPSFFHSKYRISVTYQATVSLIQSKRNPKMILPVREAIVNARGIKQPVIEEILPQSIEAESCKKLVIIGQNLKGEKTIIQIGKNSITEGFDELSNNQIQIKLPKTLTAGVKTVRVVHEPLLPDQDQNNEKIFHHKFESNLAAFILTPRITDPRDPIEIHRGHNLTVKFEPAINAEQKVAFLMGHKIITAPKRDLESSPVNEVSIPIPFSFPTGSFLLRMRVDGVDSLLEQNEKTLDFEKPKVIVI